MESGTIAAFIAQFNTPRIDTTVRRGVNDYIVSSIRTYQEGLNIVHIGAHVISRTGSIQKQNLLRS